MKAFPAKISSPWFKALIFTSLMFLVGYLWILLVCAYPSLVIVSAAVVLFFLVLAIVKFWLFES